MAIERYPVNASGQLELTQGDTYPLGTNPIITIAETSGAWLVHLGKPVALLLRYGDQETTLSGEFQHYTGQNRVSALFKLKSSLSYTLAPGIWNTQVRVSSDGGYDTIDAWTAIVHPALDSPPATDSPILSVTGTNPIGVETSGSGARVYHKPAPTTAGDYGALSIDQFGLPTAIVPLAAAADLTEETERATDAEAGISATLAAEVTRAVNQDAALAGDIVGLEDALLAQLQQLIPGAITAGSVTTTFNSDGSILEEYGTGLEVTTTFDTDGTIHEAYSAPIGLTRTTTFASDGAITETIA